MEQNNQAEENRDFIVAEISVNWIEGALSNPELGFISQRLERIINHNYVRGYVLFNLAYASETAITFDDIDTVGGRSETIIAVFQRRDGVSEERPRRGTLLPLTEGRIQFGHID